MINSQPSSTSCGNEVKDADDNEQYQDTELFEDTLVLNSPFTGTEVEKCNMDTEVIEDSDPSENMNIGITCEYEPEVVLDSEDEELNDKSARTLARGFLEGGPNPSMHLQKRWPKLPRGQVDSNATTNGKSAIGDGGTSIDAESFDDNKHLYLLGRLNHTHSAKPRDSTQAALGFIDQYLSSSKMDLSQGTQYRKITREKSPHVLSVRGSLSLAKKIKARTQNEVKEPFNWADSINQNDKENGISYKKVKTSSNVRSCVQTYKRRQKKGSHLQKNQNQGNGSNRCDESLVQGQRMATENDNSLKDLDVETCTTIENVNIYSNVSCTEEMSDIGLDTQIAAEAMDALSYPSPPGFLLNDAHRQEDAFDGSMSDVKHARQKNSSCRVNPGLHSIALNSNYRNESSCRDVGSCAIRENVHICSSAPLTEDMSDIGLDTQIAAEAMDALAYLSPLGSHSSDAHQPVDAFDGSSSDLKQIHQKSSCIDNPGLRSIPLKSNKRNVSFSRFSIVTSTSSLKHTNNQESNPVPGKTKKIRGSNSAVERKFKNNTSLSICRKGASHEEVCLSGEYTSFQPGTQEPKNWNKSCLTRTKEQPSHHTEKNNNVEETGIIRYKRKGNCLTEDPVKLDIKTKCPKLPTNSCGVARQNRLYPQVQISPRLSATGSFSSIDSWTYPKGPRGKRKRANVPKALHIGDKKRSFYSTRSPEGQDDMQPLLLAHVEISSNKSVAQLSSEISAAVASSEDMVTSNVNHTYNEHHKKPCKKNLPKTSLLKELIRLGVPKSTSDMTWKDLRHRRDMAHVRVLFSQHLDDSVIKQQKKILSRFNISIASTSMDATHFIADKFTRTKNMLEAMALGKLVVTHLWLESCGQANCFIDEKNYILRDMKKEKEIGFSMPVSLSQARQKPLLKGRRVYITPHIKPNKEVVASLVAAVHGQLVDQNQIYAHRNDKILDDLLILSCEEDNAICRHFLQKGVFVYSSELVLNGIVTQKLELERHKLFVNQVTRNNPSTFNRFGKVYRRRVRSLS